MDYITCSRTKSKYRVAVALCEVCKRMKNCPDYLNYRQPSLFPELLKGERFTKRRNRPERMKNESEEISDKPEQLMLNL